MIQKNNVRIFPFVFLGAFLGLGSAWKAEDGHAAGDKEKNKIIRMILNQVPMSTLNEDSSNWVYFTTVYLPDQDFDFGEQFYQAVNAHHIYHAKHIEFDILYKVVGPINSERDAYQNIALKMKWSEKAEMTRDVLSTLCPEGQCIPSPFRLSYRFAPRKVRVYPIDSKAGPLKYNFDSETHHLFSVDDLRNLNCLLETEIYASGSFFWNNPIKRFKMFAPAEDAEDLDGVTGATRLTAYPFLGCDIPEGGLWTSVTIFAHGYEMKERIQHLSLEDWFANFNLTFSSDT